MKAVKGLVAKLQGHKTASFCNEWSRSYREINQHTSLPWNFTTHGILHAFPDYFSGFPCRWGSRCREKVESQSNQKHTCWQEYRAQRLTCWVRRRPGRVGFFHAKVLPKPTCRSTTRTNITITFWVLNLQCYFGEAVCTGLFRTDFLHGFSARIFCTDFLHGFSARIFCTDFLHGFSAQIFCTLVCPIFFARISARIACKNCLYRCCTDFCTDFLGVSQNTCWEAPKFHRENPPKNSPCFGGLLGSGSGGKRVR